MPLREVQRVFLLVVHSILEPMVSHCCLMSRPSSHQWPYLSLRAQFKSRQCTKRPVTPCWGQVVRCDFPARTLIHFYERYEPQQPDKKGQLILTHDNGKRGTNPSHCFICFYRTEQSSDCAFAVDTLPDWDHYIITHTLSLISCLFTLNELWFCCQRLSEQNTVCSRVPDKVSNSGPQKRGTLPVPLTKLHC